MLTYFRIRKYRNFKKCTNIIQKLCCIKEKGKIEWWMESSLQCLRRISVSNIFSDGLKDAERRETATEYFHFSAIKCAEKQKDSSSSIMGRPGSQPGIFGKKKCIWINNIVSLYVTKLMFAPHIHSTILRASRVLGVLILLFQTSATSGHLHTSSVLISRLLFLEVLEFVVMWGGTTAVHTERLDKARQALFGWTPIPTSSHCIFII